MAASGLKYREVERAIRQDIESGRWQPGEKLPGEHDLARRFEVAYLTVRQAVSHLVDDGLLLRVRGKGTFLRPQDGSPSHRAFGPMALLFPANWQHIDPYYFPELVEGFQSAMESRERSASIYDYRIAETLSVLEPGCAIACLLLETEHLQLVEHLRDAGYRVLAVNHYAGRRSIPCVRIDDVLGVGRAVDHLAALGHERIGFLRGKPENIDAADRRRGFDAAVKRLGLRQASEAGAGFTEICGYAAARELLSSAQPPTAFVCASDLAAVGAIKAARDCGRFIPHDLSVVGYGDFSVAPYLLPGLTTVRQPRLDLGRAAAEALIRLEDEGDVAGAVLTPELIVRESTAPIRSVAAAALAD